MKMNKGISLIVLVITIVVILILSAVIILTLFKQGGVLDNAKKAKFMGDFRSVEEGVNIYSVSNIDYSNPTNYKLPVENKLSLSEKQDIIDNVPTLKTKIEELNPGKIIDDIDLYWINESEAGAHNIPSNKQEKGYIIDVITGQIYDYVGDFFENKRWHTLDGGVADIDTLASSDIEEIWGGWINLTLFYPEHSINKQWRLGNEGEIRVDPMLMWQDYTGSIKIPLDRVKDVWIKYKIGDEEITVPPAGTLLVDIIPDKTGTVKVDKVNVTINYDSDATSKEYKVGSSDWMPYIGGFTVTENCLIQARAKKTENVYNTDGTLLMTRNIAGKDSVYIGNIIKVDEDSSLIAPTIMRVAPIAGDEKARVQITYPANAVKKIFKINYGIEENYTSEISIKKWGTHIIAYYYDINGKKSLSTSIYINDTSASVPEDPKAYEPLPPYDPKIPIPYDIDTTKKLPAPTIMRLAPVAGDEKARIKITYPINADQRIYTKDYGPQQDYTSEISVTAWGTYIMAYYYDIDGNKSQTAWIKVDEIPTEPGSYDPIDPTEIIPAPVINIDPNIGLVSEVSVSVTAPADATNTYIKLGKYGTYQEYTAPIVVKDNIEVYAYYRNASGEKSLIAKERITNILKSEDGHEDPYVSIEASPYPWTGSTGASEVKINIVSSYCDKVEYSEDGIVYKTYTGPFLVTENKRIYARGTNAYGVTDTYLDITNIGAIVPPPVIEKLEVNINVDPEPILSTTKVASAKVTIEYDSKATEKYYSIGKYGTLQTYTGPFNVTENCTIYAYALSETGKGQTCKVVDNLLDGISDPIITSIPGKSTPASDVKINISYDKYATVKKYSVNGGLLVDYTGEFDVTTNGTTIYAYSENIAGQKSNASYTVENIIPMPPVLILDKGSYYLLKLSYPESSKVREYKWKTDGEWKEYKDAGILLIKPEYKDTVIKDGTLIKIENESGELVTFTGDYYLIDVPISELFENLFMRWDNEPPSTPQIVINPTEPAKEVTATIIYDTSVVKKQYRILKPGETLSDWIDYTGPIKIDKNNTIIYAKSMNETEVWSKEGIYKVTNIDEISPVIKLTANFVEATKSVNIKVDVTDDIAVDKVKWVPGIKSESYFATDGTEIPNNSNVNITENGYYTFYAQDKVGNMQVYTLNVGNIPPENPIISANPTGWTNGNVIVTITYSTDSVIKEYSLDGINWNNYISSVMVTENNTTVYARGKNIAGTESDNATLTVANIDKTVPTITVSNGGTTSSSITVTAIANDVGGSGINTASYQYSKDNGATWTEPTNSTNYTFTSLLKGTYNCKVKVLDNVGNCGTSNTESISTKELGTITLSASPSTWTNGDVIVTITYPAEAITKLYSLDGTTWYTYMSTLAINTNSTTVYAKGFDEGGNQFTQATLTVSNIDKTLPTVEYGTNGGNDLTQVSTTVTVSDLGVSGLNTSTLQYKWDTQNITTPSSGWASFTNGGTLTKTGDGIYYLWIKANDNAGNNVVDKTDVFIIGEIAIPVSTIKTVNTTFSGATTGFSYNNPVIPAGFVAVNTTDTSWDNLSTDWDKGLVIQDANSNQFVWVPVDGGNVTYSKWCTKGIAYNNSSLSDDTLPVGFNATNITTTYQGFYIARYESMFDYNGGSIRAASKKSINKTVSTWTRDNAHNGYLFNFVNYTDSKIYAENMATNYGYDITKVGTNLITGAEWDTVMKWIQNSGKSVTDSITWGNYQNSISPANVSGYGSLQISGYSNYWKAKNIYDLAGNEREWTNEKFSSTFVCRSGHYSYDGSMTPAAIRGGYDGTTSNTSISFRIALYVL